MTKAEAFAMQYGYYDKEKKHICCVGYNAGYKQAKKDNELTIKDLELLHTFLYAVKNNKQGVFTFTRLSDEQYNEVLRRFKEAKNANI